MHYPGVAEALDMRHEGENVGFLKEMKIIFKKKKTKKTYKKRRNENRASPWLHVFGEKQAIPMFSRRNEIETPIWRFLLCL